MLDNWSLVENQSESLTVRRYVLEPIILRLCFFIRETEVKTQLGNQ